MTTIVKRTPPNRLARMIDVPGGVSVAQAVAEAEQNLAAIHVESVQTALDLIESMTAVARDAAQPGASKLPELYSLSNQLFGLAAAVNLSVLAEAAYAFCGMTDRMRRASRWDGPSVAVYIGALEQLHGADETTPLAAEILAGLKRIAARG